MNLESRLTDALKAAGRPGPPTTAGRDAFLAEAARRRTRRRAVTTAVGLAASAAVVLGAVTLLADDDGSEVRTVPATVPPDVPRTTMAPPTTAVPVEPETLVAVNERGAVVVLETASGKVMHTLAPRGSANGRSSLARTPDGEWV